MAEEECFMPCQCQILRMNSKIEYGIFVIHFYTTSDSYSFANAPLFRISVNDHVMVVSSLLSLDSTSFSYCTRAPEQHINCHT